MVDAWAGSYAQSADGSSRNINNGVIRKGKMIYEIEYTIIGKKNNHQSAHRAYNSFVGWRIRILSDIR